MKFPRDWKAAHRYDSRPRPGLRTGWFACNRFVGRRRSPQAHTLPPSAEASISSPLSPPSNFFDAPGQRVCLKVDSSVAGATYVVVMLVSAPRKTLIAPCPSIVDTRADSLLRNRLHSTRLAVCRRAEENGKAHENQTLFRNARA